MGLVIYGYDDIMERSKLMYRNTWAYSW